jgi:hypothetical protein
MLSSARFVKILKGGRIAEAGTIGRAKRGSRVTGGEVDLPSTFLPCKSGVEIVAKGVRPLGPSANRALVFSSM